MLSVNLSIFLQKIWQGEKKRTVSTLGADCGSFIIQRNLRNCLGDEILITAGAGDIIFLIVADALLFVHILSNYCINSSNNACDSRNDSDNLEYLFHRENRPFVVL